MSDGLDFYVNLLSGDMSGLSAVSALRSMDSAAAKATSGIQALEGQLASAKSKLDALGSTEAIDALTSRLTTAREQLAAIKSGKVPFDPKEYKRASDEVGKLGSQLDAAKSKQAASIDAQKSKIEALTGKIREQKSAQASLAALNDAKRALVKKGLDEQVSGLNRVLSSAQQAGGPVGSLAGKLQSLGKGGAAGAIVAIVVALGALAVAVFYAAASLAKYALSASDAARSSQLLSAAATGSGSAGWELETVVDQLSNKIPQVRQKTAEWARELSLADIRGRDMQRTLTTMGVVASAVGDSAAGKIKGIAEASRMAQRLMLGARDRFGEFASLSGTGIKAADIYAAVAKSMRKSIPEAKRMVDAGIIPFKRGLEALEQAAETKFGPIVARQMMSLDVQATKLKENIAKLFSGANIEKFLAGLKTVTDLFDTNTVTGYVLREVFTAVFTKIADLASKAFPYIKALIEGVVVGVLVFATAAKQLYRQFQETFGGGKSGIDGLQLAFKLGVGLVAALVGSVVALSVAIVGLGIIAAVALAPIWVPIALLAAVIYGAISAVVFLKDQFAATFMALSKIDLSGAAGKIIDGFIKGLKDKIADVKSAVLEISDAVKSAFTGSEGMDMHSPSKVAEDWAIKTGEGYVKGGKKAAPMVERATIDMVPSEPGGGAGGVGQASGPVSIVININGRDDADEIARKVDERLRVFFFGEARGSALVTV